MMEPAKRDGLLADIGQAINSRGGRFDVDYETHLYIARRADGIGGNWPRSHQSHGRERGHA